MAWESSDFEGDWSVEEFKHYVDSLPYVPWAHAIALHNMGAPNLHQVMATPAKTRMKNLRHHYEVLKRWPGGPHLFVLASPDGEVRIYRGTGLKKRGVGSPSWNDDHWHVEMGADFRPGVDDDDFGVGLKVKQVSCQALAILLRHQGIKVSGRSIQLHKEDPRTTHACPGPDIEKNDILERVAAYQNELSVGGSHLDVEDPKPPKERTGTVNVVEGDTLNLRSAPGMSGNVVAKAPKGAVLKITDEAKNAVTLWYLAKLVDGTQGWVSSKFVAFGGVPATAIKPIAKIVPNKVAAPASHSEQAMLFFTTDKLFLDRPYTRTQAAGITGNLMRESYARMETGAIGDKGTAFGVGQWRNERQKDLRAFAAEKGRQPDDLIVQLAFVDHELGKNEWYPMKWLAKARTLEEAVAAMVSYERPRGWRQPPRSIADWEKCDEQAWTGFMAAARKADGFQVRLEYAKAL